MPRSDSDRSTESRCLATSASKLRKEDAARIALKKWRVMTGVSIADWQQYLQQHPGRCRRRVLAGIPDQLRGCVWQLLTGGRQLLLQNSGLYGQLLLYEHTDKDLEIVRDLSRTYPSHIYFQQRQGPGQRSLYNVLKAYSVYDNNIGYVQGMGFLAGLLLLYMSEEDAFWTMVGLLKGNEQQAPLEGLYQAGLPLLHQYTFQFGQLMKAHLPDLAQHLASEGVEAPMYCSQWFITMFAYTLPFDHLTRVWDVFLFDGPEIVFQVGLALLDLHKSDLMDMSFEELLATLNGKRFASLTMTPDHLINCALQFRVDAHLEDLQSAYKGQHPGAPASTTAADA